MSTRGGGAVFALGAIALVVMVIAAIAGPADTRRGGPRLDPRSTIESGTRAAVILMERQGRDVDVGGPAAGIGTYILFEDKLGDDIRDRLIADIEAGQSLIIADASSPIVERVSRTSSVSVGSGCDFASLADVTDLELGLVPSLAPGDIVSCYPAGDGWFVTVSSLGSGQVVAVSSPRPFTNARLGDGHNAALMIGLVDLTEGPIRILSATVGSGERSLSDLIGEPVWAALAGLLIAAIVFGLNRGRRLGRPILETDPVEIEGSELVTATARLYARADSGEHVLEAMADQLRADVETRYGFARHDSVDSIVSRLNLNESDSADIRLALTPHKPSSEADFEARVSHGVRARTIVKGPQHKPERGR